jgi:hypothetical protein
MIRMTKLVIIFDGIFNGDPVGFPIIPALIRQPRRNRVNLSPYPFQLINAALWNIKPTDF